MKDRKKNTAQTIYENDDLNLPKSNALEENNYFLWHPLTQHGLNPDILNITRAKGCILYDEKGNEYIDAIASWYTSMYGHCNDYITNKVALQMTQLDQIVFSGFTHEPAIELSKALMKILPENQAKIFFSDNGSTTVEVAIKMALQYHFNKNRKANVLLAFEDGFHGDTFGAMSVSGLSVYNGPFEEFFLEVKRLPVPNAQNIASVLEEIENITAQNQVAAFIYEPLVQGAAAMKMHEPAVLNPALEKLRSKDILLIADEVMTGFGKTGSHFASDFISTKPDIICLSKALTAGLIPMGITSCTKEIYDAFLSKKIEKGFFHGHTYSGNPLACTAALAALELLQSKQIKQNITWIIEQHKDFDSRIKTHPKVKSTRQQGVIFALDINLEIDRYGNIRDKLFRFFMDNGVYLRPLGNTIYIQPPYVISKDQLHKIYDTIEKVLGIV